MSVKENLETIASTVEAFNERDWDTYLSAFAESVTTYEPDESEPIHGRSGLHKRIDTYTTAFPDVRLEVERLFGQRDLVCLNSLFIGTHRGRLPAPGRRLIDPTNRPVRVHGCSVFRFEGGEIMEFYGYYDQVELLAQLGVTLP